VAQELSRDRFCVIVHSMDLTWEMVLNAARSFMSPDAESTQSCSYRILCYGDSLTAGWHANGKRFSPYGKILQDSLRSLGVQCDVSVCGLSGRRADQMVVELDSPACQPDMVGKRGKGLAHMLDTEGPYDLVILMAGTNDFDDWPCSLKPVSDAVCKLHSACHMRGVPTVMLAAPCNVAKVRKGLGHSLHSWASRNTSKVLTFIDPEDVMPRSNFACWEPDQLHFTPEGSRTLGAHLASVLVSIVPELCGQITHGQKAAGVGHRSNLAGPTSKPQANPSLASKQMLHRPPCQMASPVLMPRAAALPRFSARGGA